MVRTRGVSGTRSVAPRRMGGRLGRRKLGANTKRFFSGLDNDTLRRFYILFAPETEAVEVFVESGRKKLGNDGRIWRTFTGKNPQLVAALREPVGRIMELNDERGELSGTDAQTLEKIGRIQTERHRIVTNPAFLGNLHKAYLALRRAGANLPSPK